MSRYGKHEGLERVVNALETVNKFTEIHDAAQLIYAASSPGGFLSSKGTNRNFTGYRQREKTGSQVRASSVPRGGA
ncbi:MAG: hypothetical protein CAF45_002235 [Nitrospira sp. CG24E]|nr:MAG: hypothetical protein CAF45_002235 [Nitrospira sp. CG24E]